MHYAVEKVGQNSGWGHCILTRDELDLTFWVHDLCKFNQNLSKNCNHKSDDTQAHRQTLVIL